MPKSRSIQAALTGAPLAAPLTFSAKSRTAFHPETSVFKARRIK
jgi:hypothetical protein